MSNKRLTPRMILATLAVPASLLFAGCSIIPTKPVAKPLTCSALVPEEWKHRQDKTPLPDNTAGGWVSFGLTQTNKLATAEDRQQDTLTIITTCEKMNAH